MRNSSPSPSSRSHSHSFLDDVSFGEDIDLTVGLTSAAFGINELFEAAQDRRHRARHLLKAGLASAVSAGAFAIMHREHHQNHHHDRGRSRSRSPNRGRHRDHEHLHSPHLRSRSSPNLQQDTKPHPGNKLPYPDDVETQRGYFSDDESKVFGNGHHSKLPQLQVTEKAVVKSWAKHHGRDNHKSPSDNSDTRRQKDRDDRYHRSPSPSPPRHRNSGMS